MKNESELEYGNKETILNPSEKLQLIIERKNREIKELKTENKDLRDRNLQLARMLCAYEHPR